MRALALISLLFACNTGKVDGDDDSDGADDGSTADDGGDSGSEGDGPKVAELTTPSDGECPDLSASGTSTFSSGGEDRDVTVIIPEGGGSDMPVVFFFHGLMDPGYTPEPTDYMADNLDLQNLADQTGTVIVLPESRVVTMYGVTVFMWEVMEQDELDLVLYDDLRSCIGTELSVDLDRLSATGVSGGALFMTVMVRERADTLSAAVEMSGGSDVENSLFPNIVSRYGTPAAAVPTLLATGGDEDVWPDPSLVIVDFTEATDTLEGKLADDGHTVVRCRHDSGHTITWDEWDAGWEWITAHEFGVPSPYAEGGIGDWDSWCEAVN